MTLFSAIFYILAIIMIVSTVLAITQRLLVHALVYLIISFLATGLLFYLLGAPFLAALEVIIYAGAIMVLFLFIVMTLVIEERERRLETFRQWIPATVLSVISFFVAGVLIFEAPGSRETLNAGMATPAAFGQFIFKNYWFPVEIASFLLLIGLVGTLYLGKREPKPAGNKPEDKT